MTGKTASAAPPARKWVPLDLKEAKIDAGGLVEDLLASIEMKSVWEMLWTHRDKFNGIGPAASLVITLGGLMRGPHRGDWLTEADRRATADRIDSLCEELAAEIQALRDRDFGLPSEIQWALEAAAAPTFERWHQGYLQPTWNSALHCFIEVIEEAQEAAGVSPCEADSEDGDVNDDKIDDVILEPDISDVCDETLANILAPLAEDTERQFEGLVTEIEPILWALQDGIRDWRDGSQLVHKPNDEAERRAYVIRGIHGFFRRHFGKAMSKETQIVVSAVWKLAKDGNASQGNVSDPRVAEIMKPRQRSRSRKVAPKSSG